MTKQLIESTINRLMSHNNEHDCGSLTAFRADKTNKENKKRNKVLLAKLLSNGYGVTSLVGKYPEGGEETKEMSFFVVNLKDDKDFIKKITKLGILFEQDSVLIIPVGSINGKNKAYLIGTNNSDNNWLSFGSKNYFDKTKLAKTNKIYTSYVNGRPFFFEEVGQDIKYPQTGFGWWNLLLYSNKIIE